MTFYVIAELQTSETVSPLPRSQRKEARLVSLQPQGRQNQTHDFVDDSLRHGGKGCMYIRGRLTSLAPGWLDIF